MALPPRTLRPLSRIRIGIPSFRATRSYQSSEHPAPSLYPPIESAILSSALSHVPSHGFTPLALRLGARDAGYLDVSTNLFPRGVFELVHFHLVTRRLALKDEVQFPVDGKEISGSGKVRTLLLGRLMANEKARVVQRWPEALAIMAQPSFIPPSLAELARLSDEIWYLAGDTSVDSSWYTKRASLSAIYSSAELFMTSDTSTDFRDTEQFVTSRLEDARTIGGFLGGLGQWASFTGHAVVNVARSKGMGI